MPPSSGSNPSDSSQQTQSNPTVDLVRMQYAFMIGMTGILAAAFITLILIFLGWKVASDIVAVVGLFTSASGTLVGTFFGLQVGSAGKEAEQQERQKIQRTTARALALLSPEQATRIFKNLEE